MRESSSTPGGRSWEAAPPGTMSAARTRVRPSHHRCHYVKSAGKYKPAQPEPFREQHRARPRYGPALALEVDRDGLGGGRQFQSTRAGGRIPGAHHGLVFPHDRRRPEFGRNDAFRRNRSGSVSGIRSVTRACYGHRRRRGVRIGEERPAIVCKLFRHLERTPAARKRL